jgi:uncharacterized membrane protein YoaT (DUF817 family)
MFNLQSYKNVSPIKNFLFLCVVLGISYASVWILGRKPWLALLPIVLTSILALLYIRSWKLLLVYIFFALYGTGMEIFFITNGFWSYDVNSFLSIPFYLPFIWGNIGILSVGIFKGIIMVFGNRLRHNPPPFLQSCIATALGFIGLALSVRFFSHYPLRLVLILLVIDILYVLYMQSIPLAIVGIFALAGGTIGDLISVWLGIWSYSATAKVAGIPPYVFIGWDLNGILMAGLYIVLDTQDSPIPHWIKKKLLNFYAISIKLR